MALSAARTGKHRKTRSWGAEGHDTHVAATMVCSAGCMLREAVVCGRCVTTANGGGKQPWTRLLVTAGAEVMRGRSDLGSSSGLGRAQRDVRRSA
jgi:hypothetical protein